MALLGCGTLVVERRERSPASVNCCVIAGGNRACVTTASTLDAPAPLSALTQVVSVPPEDIDALAAGFSEGVEARRHLIGIADHHATAFERFDIGITELGNAIATIERDAAALQVAGVDDHWEGLDRLDLVQRRLAASAPAVLLAHEPDLADISAATGRFALQLSGHSHGGQINLPLLGPPLLPPFALRYPRGASLGAVTMPGSVAGAMSSGSWKRGGGSSFTRMGFGRSGRAPGPSFPSPTTGEAAIRSQSEPPMSTVWGSCESMRRRSCSNG